MAAAFRLLMGRLSTKIVSHKLNDLRFGVEAFGTPFGKSERMESAARSPLLPRAFVRYDPAAPAWTTTVAVIRFPRFTVVDWLRRTATPRSEDPVAAFATETELQLRRSS